MRLGLLHVPVPARPHLTGALAGARAVPETCDWHRYIDLDGVAAGKTGQWCSAAAGTWFGGTRN
jgi:hypothetical protein